MLKIIKSRPIVAYLAIARGQSTICSGYLIYIAITLKYTQSVICQKNRQHLIIDTYRIDKLHCREIILSKLLAVFRIHQMLRKCLKSIGCEIRIIPLTRREETTHQLVKLLLVYLLLGALSDNAACTYII